MPGRRKVICQGTPHAATPPALTAIPDGVGPATVAVRVPASRVECSGPRTRPGRDAAARAARGPGYRSTTPTPAEPNRSDRAGQDALPPPLLWRRRPVPPP